MSVSLEGARANQELTLREALSDLSKDALTTIRKNASVKNVSKLNREQLVEALVEMLPSTLERELMPLLAVMDTERITLLDYATEKNGAVVVGDEWTEQMTKYWQELGLLFKRNVSGRDLMIMPNECISVVKSVLSQLDRKVITLNTKLIQMVKGMLYYYGSFSHESLNEIVSRYPMFEALQAPSLHVIISYRHYRSDFGINEQYIFHHTIPNPTLIINEQNKREDLQYAQFTALQLEEAGEPSFVNRGNGYKILLEMLLKQFQLPQFEAQLIADQIEFGVRAGLQLQDLLQYLTKELKLNDEAINLMLPRLIITYNDTAQWCLKGHTSTSLSTGAADAVEAQPEVKAPVQLGRNDACYCGSGKKYKKCCMNK